MVASDHSYPHQLQPVADGGRYRPTRGYHPHIDMLVNLTTVGLLDTACGPHNSQGCPLLG